MNALSAQNFEWINFSNFNGHTCKFASLKRICFCLSIEISRLLENILIYIVFFLRHSNELRKDTMFINFDAFFEHASTEKQTVQNFIHFSKHLLDQYVKAKYFYFCVIFKWNRSKSYLVIEFSRRFD